MFVNKKGDKILQDQPKGNRYVIQWCAAVTVYCLASIYMYANKFFDSCASLHPEQENVLKTLR